MKTTTSHARGVVKAHARGRRMRVGEAAARVKAGLPVAELDALRDLLGPAAAAGSDGCARLHRSGFCADDESSGITNHVPSAGNGRSIDVVVSRIR